MSLCLALKPRHPSSRTFVTILFKVFMWIYIFNKSICVVGSHEILKCPLVSRVVFVIFQNVVIVINGFLLFIYGVFMLSHVDVLIYLFVYFYMLYTSLCVLL